MWRKDSSFPSGDFVFIPKGVPHNYQSGPSGGKVIVISPAGLEKYFRKSQILFRLVRLHGKLEQEIARRYGQEFLNSLNHWGQ